MANPPVQLTLDPVTATATFQGLDEHIRVIAIPIERYTELVNSLNSLDTRLHTLEIPPGPKTYTVSFQTGT